MAPGETDAAALARELREELGIDVTVGARLGADVALTRRRRCAPTSSPRRAACCSPTITARCGGSAPTNSTSWRGCPPTGVAARLPPRLRARGPAARKPRRRFLARTLDIDTPVGGWYPRRLPTLAAEVARVKGFRDAYMRYTPAADSRSLPPPSRIMQPRVGLIGGYRCRSRDDLPGIGRTSRTSVVSGADVLRLSATECQFEHVEIAN